MNFLQLPQELRILIYSELLYQPDPIKFIECHAISDPDFIFEELEAPDLPLPLRSSGSGLCPALLQVNKQIYNEAISILYSWNTLQFPTFWFNLWKEYQIPGIPHIHISPFLTQIRHEAAALIHHIRIILPSMAWRFEKMDSKLCEEESFEHMRDLCTGITTLELDLQNSHFLHAARDFDERFEEFRLSFMEREDAIAQTLRLLDAHFKAIPSLEAIIVNYQVDNNVDEEIIHDDEHELMKKMQEYGWVVRITKSERAGDDEKEIDNEEDDNA